MYQLYYSPGACSMAPHVILNEIGAKVELKRVELSKGDGQKPEFLKINPRGQIPVLIDEDGERILEGAAMIIYLCEKHNSPLLPKPGKERLHALEWLMSANASLHPAYAKAFFTNKNADADKEKLFKAAFDQINKLWKEADDQLAKTKYLCGEQVTAADILYTVIANWGAYFPPGSVILGSNVKRLIKEISQRPAYQKALKEEQVEYKAAA